MSEDIKDVKVVKSPFVEDSSMENIVRIDQMTINITLPNGMIITNPEQFQDEKYEYIEDHDTYV